MKQAALKYNFGALPMKQTARWLFYNYQLEQRVSPLLAIAHFQFSQTDSVALPIYIYRVSQEECARLREGVPYVKVYRYNLKHLCPKLNGYGDNG